MLRMLQLLLPRLPLPLPLPAQMHALVPIVQPVEPAAKGEGLLERNRHRVCSSGADAGTTMLHTFWTDLNDNVPRRPCFIASS